MSDEATATVARGPGPLRRFLQTAATRWRSGRLLRGLPEHERVRLERLRETLSALDAPSGSRGSVERACVRLATRAGALERRLGALDPGELVRGIEERLATLRGETSEGDARSGPGDPPKPHAPTAADEAERTELEQRERLLQGSQRLVARARGQMNMVEGVVRGLRTRPSGEVRSRLDALASSIERVADELVEAEASLVAGFGSRGD